MKRTVRIIALLALLASLSSCASTASLDRRIAELEAENRALREELAQRPALPEIHVESRLDFGPPSPPAPPPVTALPPAGALGELPRG